MFGHYNLGHVLFLQGRFDEARQAYDEGLARDLSRTPRQRLRLALTLAALDDEDAGTRRMRARRSRAPLATIAGIYWMRWKKCWKR